MRKLLFTMLILGCCQATFAQDKKTEKSETVIIEDENNNPSHTTIEIINGEVFMNGKKVDQNDKDGKGSVKIYKKKFLNGKEVPFDDEEMEIMTPPFEDLNSSPNKAMLGVTFKPGENEEGAVVETVIPKSPAEKMGIMAGDIITKVDDKNINNPKDLVTAISGYKPGDMVDITFERDNKMMTKKATLDKQNGGMSFNRSFPFNEDMFKEFTPMFRNFGEQFPGMNSLPNSAPAPKIGVSVEDRADGEGVLVQEVTEGSAAGKAGIMKNDVITEYGGKPIGSVDELMQLIRDNQGKNKVEITLKRDGSTKRMELTIPKNLKKRDL